MQFCLGGQGRKTATLQQTVHEKIKAWLPELICNPANSAILTIASYTLQVHWRPPNPARLILTPAYFRSDALWDADQVILRTEQQCHIHFSHEAHPSRSARHCLS